MTRTNVLLFVRTCVIFVHMKTLHSLKNASRANDWHYTEIESAVKRRFGSYAGLARAWNAEHPDKGISRYTLVKSARQRQSELGETVISWGIEVPAAVIWPTRYDIDGVRIKYRARSEAKHTAEQPCGPSKAAVFEALLGTDAGSGS
ncbi:helix-turn-helix domain-containing protein [Marinobacterium rhizophilum]|uniref:Helix-turn-helix domain-containing protein n=1 Tax=Marinobacterium rhizophilum TaxID=420402 RepID=A0ABY5HKP5_9GAMM|nr:helix-turn-helix domain-containing protein [Marinobacterium rhizophilum]UTW12961.1 helix-turn-helix domain-containing protein [Marinobacterium rhizophilum]